LGFEDEPHNVAHALAPYALLVVDEISQLTDQQFDHLVQLRKFVDKVTATALVGDRRQMAGQGGARPWDSPNWRKHCFVTNLHVGYRCKDPSFMRVLTLLRTAMPKSRRGRGLTVPQIMRGGRAWRGNEPAVQDIRRVLMRHPHTTMLAVTRRGAGLLNDLALQAKFPRREPLAVLPGDVEANPENYAGGQLKDPRDLRPLELKIYKNMQVYLTRNVNKSTDFVNGMRARVESYDAPSRGLRVITSTGYRVVVWPWTDTDLGNITYYPVRPGYASTVVKFQGAELEHVVLYLVAYAPGLYKYIYRTQLTSTLHRPTADHATPLPYILYVSYARCRK
ncbi:MAG: hypothetical protein GY772_00860, partial [bacterium]|nr:hypothetical protein [bacterium]